MRKLLVLLFTFILTVSSAYAAKIPDDVKNFIKKDFQKTDFRFDGLITLPDGTMYLPLLPALIKKPDAIVIKSTYPDKTVFSKKPDVVIFNNDFALMKVLIDQKGRKTVLKLDNPPVEVKTGLLPQDMLVPKGLIIPDNIKGIIGNLQIATAIDAGLRIKSEASGIVPVSVYKAGVNQVSSILQLKDKTIYIATCYSKNIHVVNGEATEPEYALSQKSIPIDIKSVDNDKFLLVTTYSKTFMDVISLADERVIKQIDFTTQPAEIVIDKKNNKAYISSPDASCIYWVDLNNMTLKQKIKINGFCEHLYLSADGTKLFYSDKKTNEVYAVELNNNYIIRDVGRFPNVSKIVYTANKIYITSRTKNRLAIIDYDTMGLIKEMEVAQKPIDMLAYKNELFILGAQENMVQVLETETDEVISTIHLNTQGFSTKLYQLNGTNIAIATDTKAGKYSVLSLDKKQVIKTNRLDIPVSEIVVTNRSKKIDKI